MNSTMDPLTAALSPEIPLPKAPLVRVITQVRFPLIVSIVKREFIAPFQESIRSSYPILREEKTQGVIFGPQGVAQSQAQAVWRFSDVEGKWRVSLAPEFIALETTSYSSRSDFINRLDVVVKALAEHVGPKVADRLGVRYVDRVTGRAVNDIPKLVRGEVLGIIATPAAAHAQHALSELLFSVPGGNAQLLVRLGRVPRGGTVDPSAIEPIDEPSWILDIDMFCAESRPFDPDLIVNDARAYAERIYTFFRWAVTDDFLRLYGGKV